MNPPHGPPTPPLNPVAESDNTAALVSWDVPEDDGGGEGVTKYTVTSDPAGAGPASFSVDAPATQLVYEGLTNGQEYTFTVTATNNQGVSAASVATEPVTPDDGYGTHTSDGGGWQRFWWFNPGSNVDKGVYNDVLQHPFGTCRKTDPFCFQRLPAELIEQDTELLAVDSAGTIYKWNFQPWVDTAHRAWLAFHDHEETPHPFYNKQAWNPRVISGSFSGHATQDAFQYRMSNGFKSLALDDDNCDVRWKVERGIWNVH